jgi:hypothetical protein
MGIIGSLRKDLIGTKWHRHKMAGRIANENWQMRTDGLMGLGRRRDDEANMHRGRPGGRPRCRQ